MKAIVFESDQRGLALSVDAYNRLSKSAFVKLLAKNSGVKIIRKPSVFHPHVFCIFEFHSESFFIEEDDYDYCFNIIPQNKNKNKNREALESLQKFFFEQEIPEYKTRPIFWLISFLIVGIVIHIKLQSS